MNLAIRSLSLSSLLALSAALAHAQFGGTTPDPEKLVQVRWAPLSVTAGQTADAAFVLAIEPSWHINANPPNPDYMIATELTFKPVAGFKPGRVAYPPPKKLKVGFEESELSVYDGSITLRVPIVTAPTLASGSYTLEGSLRFQGCNDQLCLAPVTIPVSVVVKVAGTNGVAVPHGDPVATTDSTRAPPAAGVAEDTSRALTGRPETFAGTGRPSPAMDNPLARALDRGGWAAFLTLFVIGLALNLTPCVYPMLGVTVSIFGARRAAPPLQVFGMAVLYVLGMATMYSSLGLIAAFTGGLFGGLLQNPIVLVGLGVLLIALALSMFGLYEIQVPYQLLGKLGGNTATSAMGTFLSGLVVGIFAAPCVGPPVVALLAVVGAKADPWFGFISFFTLALGLGAPYLVLAMFSNLIQALPRSGEWMVWVKKVFGVILVALGLFYACLALAPGLAPWIAPVAFILGGAYLGFFERSSDQKPRFRLLKRATGAVAVIMGAVMVITAPTSSEGIAFEPFSAQALQLALAAGQPAMLDFTATWCAPCHELERFTFTDKRVKERARAFRTFRVDLTRYDSPDAERWRREYAITGVPTVVFLTPGGDEVHAARVEGFLPPQMFLERMSVAQRGEQRAAE